MSAAKEIEEIQKTALDPEAKQKQYQQIIETSRQQYKDDILGLYDVERQRLLAEADTAKVVYNQAQEAYNIAYDLYKQSLTDGSSYEVQQKYYDKLTECNDALSDAQDWMNSIDESWSDVTDGVIEYYNEVSEAVSKTNDLELSINERLISDIDRDYSHQQRNRTQQIRLGEKAQALQERNDLLAEKMTASETNANRTRADFQDIYDLFGKLGLNPELMWTAEGEATRFFDEYLEFFKEDEVISDRIKELFAAVSADKSTYMDAYDESLENTEELYEIQQELWQLGLDLALKTAENIMNVHDNIISALQKEEELLERQLGRTSKYSEQQEITQELIKTQRSELQRQVNRRAEANLTKENLYNNPEFADLIAKFDTSKWVDVNGERTAYYWNDINDLQRIGSTEEYNNAEKFVQLLEQVQGFIADADSAVLDTQDKIKESVDAYYQRQVDAANTAVETVISMIEKRKEKELKALEQVHDARVEQLNKESELVQNIYNRAVNLLDDAKSEEDYQSQLAKEQKKADNLQAQIDQYALDNSDAAVQKRLELQKELNEQLETIDELKRNHEYEQTKEALNDDLEVYNEHFTALQEAENKQYEFNQKLIEARYTQEAMY